MTEVAVRVADRVVAQIGTSLGVLDGQAVEDVAEDVLAQIEALLPGVQGDGGVVLSEDHGTVTLKAPSAAWAVAEQAAQQAEQAAGLQRAQDACTLLNSSVARDSQASRDALARLIAVRPLAIPLGQDAQPGDVSPL